MEAVAFCSKCHVRINKPAMFKNMEGKIKSASGYIKVGCGVKGCKGHAKFTVDKPEPIEEVKETVNS